MKKKLLSFFAGFMAIISGAALAATFNLFSPANGILVGNPNTYVTTAATSANVRALWSGTCNSTTFLRGDGTCAGETGTGTVTSVGLTMPSGFSVANSPVTTSGTLNVTTTLNGVLRGTGSGFTTSTSTNIIGLWTGTCDASTFLRGDGSCQVAGGGTSGANPSATIGLTAVNGVATTFLRSDGAPALSQAIVPTWTAKHIFSQSATLASNLMGLSVDSNLPILQFTETDGAANNQRWIMGSDATQFVIAPLTDAGGAPATYPFAMTRSGNSATALAMTVANDVTVRGTQLEVRNATGSGYNPVAVCAEGETTNNQCWALRIGGGADFQIVTADDTGAQVNTALDITRTGTTVTGIAMTATTVTANGGDVVTTTGGSRNPVRLAFAGISTAGGSTCSLQTQSGFSGCTRNSTGNYSLTVNASISNNTACTVTSGDTNVKHAVTNNLASSSTVNAVFYNDSHALADPGSFSVTCMSVQ